MHFSLLIHPYSQCYEQALLFMNGRKPEGDPKFMSTAAALMQLVKSKSLL